jgi:hypothetical protein
MKIYKLIVIAFFVQGCSKKAINNEPNNPSVSQHAAIGKVENGMLKFNSVVEYVSFLNLSNSQRSAQLKEFAVLEEFKM